MVGDAYPTGLERQEADPADTLPMPNNRNAIIKNALFFSCNMVYMEYDFGSFFIACRRGTAHRNIIHQEPHRLSHPFHLHPNPVDNPHFSHTGETLNTANL